MLSPSLIHDDADEDVVVFLAVPVAARRPMSAYDYNNSRDYPVARHWSGPISDDSSDV